MNIGLWIANGIFSGVLIWLGDMGFQCQLSCPVFIRFRNPRAGLFFHV